MSAPREGCAGHMLAVLFRSLAALTGARAHAADSRGPFYFHCHVEYAQRVRPRRLSSIVQTPAPLASVTR